MLGTLGWEDCGECAEDLEAQHAPREDGGFVHGGDARAVRGGGGWVAEDVLEGGEVG